MDLRLKVWRWCSRRIACVWIACAAAAAAAVPMMAQAPAPGLDNFHWIDLHNEKDAPTVAWVTQALKAEHWTAMREIGANGDSAIVVTTDRKDPQATPDSDAFTIWSVSLAKHDVQPLLHGVNLHLLNWTNFGGVYQRAPELAIVFNDCTGCDAPSLFFTTIYYNLNDHAWRGRWMRGDQAVALKTTAHIDGVKQTQVYGMMTELPGRDILATWSHLDYGGTKPAEDYFYEYGVDPSGMEQTQALGPDHAEKMKARLCQANPGLKDPALAVLAGGQDSDLCKGTPEPAKPKRGEHVRRPTTTPPANNHGQSSPGGAKPKPPQ